MFGAFVAILDQEESEERLEQQVAAREAWAADLATLEAELSRGKAVSELVSLVVGNLGYARYARNPWKRRTMRSIDPPEGMTSRQARTDIHKAVKAARTGDRTALDRLKELGRSFPAIVADEAVGDI